MDVCITELADQCRAARKVSGQRREEVALGGDERAGCIAHTRFHHKGGSPIPVEAEKNPAAAIGAWISQQCANAWKMIFCKPA